MSEPITILKAQTGVLTKRFYRDSEGNIAKTSFDRMCLWFDAIESDPVSDIFGLHELLTNLEAMPDCCVIRGRIKEGKSAIHGVRKLLHDAANGDKAWFEDKPCSWLLIDFDDILAPEGLPEDLRLTYLIDQLPECFQNVTCHYRWSASAGMDNWQTLSCHLWFWLSDAWESATIRRRIAVEDWGQADSSPFDGVHIHYTAAPIFDGVADPIAGKRSGLLRGERDVVDLPPFVEPAPVPREYRPVLSSTFDQQFEQMLAKIGPNYHQPIRSCIRWYVGNAPEIDEYDLKSRLEYAIAVAAPGRSSKRDYNSHYLERSIRGAIRKFS